MEGNELLSVLIFIVVLQLLLTVALAIPYIALVSSLEWEKRGKLELVEADDLLRFCKAFNSLAFIVVAVMDGCRLFTRDGALELYGDAILLLLCVRLRCDTTMPLAPRCAGVLIGVAGHCGLTGVGIVLTCRDAVDDDAVETSESVLLRLLLVNDGCVGIGCCCCCCRSEFAYCC
jgi:hypothetical protein